MAFNPFRGFRKQQKVIFAILTIICMLTFVLAGNFRGGDALDWVVSLFGGGKKGNYVATLYGDKIYDVELSRQDSDRRLANYFMAAAFQEGARETAEELRREVLKPLPSDASPMDSKYREEVRFAYLQSSFTSTDQDRNAVLKQLYPNDPRGPLAAALDDFQSLLQKREFRRRYLQVDPLKDLRQLLAQLLDQKMEREAQLVAGIIMLPFAQRARQPEGAFFAASTRRQDLLDERVWWHHADKLGIKLTDADIRAEVNRVSPVKDVLTSSGIPTSLRERLKGRYKDVDLSLVYKALGNELRASMAQGIVLGEEAGLRGELRGLFQRPAGITPAEYVHFYDKQRTTLTVDLIAVPAKEFLPEAGKLPPPTEEQKKELFEAYKAIEPDPGSSTPGFKEPQRVGLEWIALTSPTEATFRKVARAFPLTGSLGSLKDPREQHYLEVAKAILKPALKPKDPALFLGGTGLPLPVPALAAPGPLGPLAFGGAWAVLGREALLNRAYEALMTKFEVPSLLQADPALSYYTALNLPTVITSWVGMTAPNSGPAWPLNTLVTSQMAAVERGRKYQADALKQDVKKRARLVAGMTLASLGPALTRATTWAAAELSDASSDLKPAVQPRLLLRYVNREALRFQVFDEAASNLARFFREKDLADLTRAIEEASKDPETDPKAVDAALKRYPWLATYHGRTEQAVDRYTLATSPRYRSLLANDSTTPQTLSQRLQGAKWYFGGDAKERDLRRSPRSFLPEKLFTPTEHGGMLVWKTEDVPARTPTRTDVEDKVERAWRMREARKLARAKAEEIRDRVAGKKPAEALTILRGILAEHPSWSNLIRLDKVARQVPVEDEDAATPPPLMQAHKSKQATTYTPYRVPEEDVAYPPANFVSQLVELPAHRAAVIADRPLKHFYVAYVETRSPRPSVEAVLAKTFPTGVAHDISQNKLWQLMEGEKQQELRAELMKELRRQAGTLNAKGRFALNPNLKAETRNTGSEE